MGGPGRLRPPRPAPRPPHLQLLEDLEGEQLLPEIVPALDDDGEEAPGGEVAVGGPFSDPPGREERRGGAAGQPWLSPKGRSGSTGAERAPGTAHRALAKPRCHGCPGQEASPRRPCPPTKNYMDPPELPSPRGGPLSELKWGVGQSTPGAGTQTSLFGANPDSPDINGARKHPVKPPATARAANPPWTLPTPPADPPARCPRVPGAQSCGHSAAPRAAPCPYRTFSCQGSFRATAEGSSGSRRKEVGVCASCSESRRLPDGAD